MSITSQYSKCFLSVNWSNTLYKYWKSLAEFFKLTFFSAIYNSSSCVQVTASSCTSIRTSGRTAWKHLQSTQSERRTLTQTLCAARRLSGVMLKYLVTVQVGSEICSLQNSACFSFPRRQTIHFITLKQFWKTVKHNSESRFELLYFMKKANFEYNTQYYPVNFGTESLSLPHVPTLQLGVTYPNILVFLHGFCSEHPNGLPFSARAPIKGNLFRSAVKKPEGFGPQHWPEASERSVIPVPGDPTYSSNITHILRWNTLT